MNTVWFDKKSVFWLKKMIYLKSQFSNYFKRIRILMTHNIEHTHFHSRFRCTQLILCYYRAKQTNRNLENINKNTYLEHLWPWQKDAMSIVGLQIYKLCLNDRNISSFLNLISNQSIFFIFHLSEAMWTFYLKWNKN